MTAQRLRDAARGMRTRRPLCEECGVRADDPERHEDWHVAIMRTLETIGERGSRMEEELRKSDA